MTQKGASALVIAHPSWLRNALQALVRATLQLENVEQAGDGSSAFEMISKTSPAFVLLGTELPDAEIWTVLRRIKTSWPKTQCLVLVSNAKQCEMAQTVGADAVLVRGFGANTFTETMGKLLKRIDQENGDTRAAEKATDSSG